MKHYYLPYYSGDSGWYISPWSGSLLQAPAARLDLGKLELPKKLENALAVCDDPFSCRWLLQQSDPLLDPTVFANVEKSYHRLVRISSRRFLLSILYARLNHPCVDTTHEVFSALSQVPDAVENRAIRCLQRCLTAAKTSKSFKKDGILFIGASIDSLTMHAWILEDGMQPDPYDRQWINYRPLLAFCF